MFPVEEDDKLEMSHLTENKLNFGATCKKWLKDDTLPWCFVGFDSACSDRKRDHIMWENKLGVTSSNMDEIPMQYSSRMPCGEEEQVEHVTLAQERCRAWSWLAEAIVILDFLVCVPAGVVIFG